VQHPRAGLLGHVEPAQQRRVQRRVAQPDPVALQPDGVQRLAEDVERLDGAALSYSIAGVDTSPKPRRSKTARSASVMARSSRISSGRTSRVPLGIGWITGLVRRPVNVRRRAPRAAP
jgi:hypothetical protein